MPSDSELLQHAVDLAAQAAVVGGGPFGAVIARDGEVIAEGTNGVTSGLDPTAHAEIVAIRAACTRLESFTLHGCVLLTSCEPCPMCLAAAWWARVERIGFAASRDDAATAGFDDSAIYDEVARPIAQRVLPIERIALLDPVAPFTAWTSNPQRTDY